MTDSERKLADMIQRFLIEGEYNDEGNYVFVSDTPETGPLAEPDTMVPKVVLDASALLRELQGTGKLDEYGTVEGKKAAAKLLLDANLDPAALRAAYEAAIPGTPTDAELSANHKALRKAFAAPLQSYSVTWRRPAAAYAHDEIEATSLEDAMMQAKTRVTSNRSDLYFDSDCDGMDTVDWISVEGNREHTEWELPKPSAGALMKALHDIRVLCESMSYQPGSALLEIDAVARKAIEASVPDYSEPHTYDDERDAS